MSDFKINIKLDTNISEVTEEKEVISVNTLSEMKSLTNVAENEIVIRKGYDSITDETGCHKYRTILGNSLTADDGAIIQNNSGTLTFLYEGKNIPAGVYGFSKSATGLQNSNRLQSAIDYCSSIQETLIDDKVDIVKNSIEIQSGIFPIQPGIIKVKEGVNIRGQGMNNTVFKSISGQSGVIIQIGDTDREYSGIEVADIGIVGDGTGLLNPGATVGLIGIFMQQCYRLCLLRRISVWRCDINISIDGFAFKLEDCYSISSNQQCLNIINGTSSEIVGGRYEYGNVNIRIVGGAGTEPISVTFTNVACQNANTAGLIVDLDQFSSSTNVALINFNGCFFEGNSRRVGFGDGDIFITNDTNPGGGNIMISNCFFTSTGSSPDTRRPVTFSSNTGIKALTIQNSVYRGAIYDTFINVGTTFTIDDIVLIGCTGDATAIPSARITNTGTALIQDPFTIV